MDIIQKLKSRLDDFHLNLWNKNLTLNRNEFLKVEGSTDTNIYYVESGTLRIFIQDEAEEHTIRFGYKGNIVVALDSFITGNPSVFYIQALKSCQLKVMPKSNFEKFLQYDPDHVMMWTKLMEGLVYQQLEREIDLLTSSPTERYKRVLKRSPNLFQEVPNKYIASYLRMTPETISRIKKKT